jgi:hypothetical protein
LHAGSLNNIRLATPALLSGPTTRASRSLQGNALEGSLPTSWAAAPSLRVLQLDNNRLNGSLADAALPRGVRQVTLSGNALEGGVSPALAERFPDLRWGQGYYLVGGGAPVQHHHFFLSAWRGGLRAPHAL